MLKIFRLVAILHRIGVPLLPRLLYLVNRVAFGIVLPPTCRVGKRVTFAYSGLAVVVHARAVIGDDCYIGPQVIIGGRSGHLAVPVIGNGAFLGAGACLLGPIHVGDNVVVGARSLVLKSIDADDIVAGNPARSVKRRAKTSAANLVVSSGFSPQDRVDS